VCVEEKIYRVFSLYKSLSLAHKNIYIRIRKKATTTTTKGSTCKMKTNDDKIRCWCAGFDQSQQLTTYTLSLDYKYIKAMYI